MRDEDLVRAALAVARRAPATGDVPIGALVRSPDGVPLSEACNAREALGDPTAHAEILALRSAAAVRGEGWRLTDCTLVVTVEPCTMCSGNFGSSSSSEPVGESSASNSTSGISPTDVASSSDASSAPG